MTSGQRGGALPIFSQCPHVGEGESHSMPMETRADNTCICLSFRESPVLTTVPVRTSKRR
jgi:hypothetical protein